MFILECTYGRPGTACPTASVVDGSSNSSSGRSARGRSGRLRMLGKSRATRLTDAGFAVVQHAEAFRISAVYERFGVALGSYRCYCGEVEPGEVLIVPPGRAAAVPGPTVRIALTGWAIDKDARRRLRADHALALSDHADYDELFEAVERVGAKKVFCTHGPESFVDRLRERGVEAFPLDPAGGRRH